MFSLAKRKWESRTPRVEWRLYRGKRQKGKHDGRLRRGTTCCLISGEKGKGLVSLVLMGKGGREIELRLKERYRVTPQIRGAIKSVPGVVDIREI